MNFELRNTCLTWIQLSFQNKCHRTNQWNLYSIGYPDVVLVTREKSAFDEEFYRKASETSTPHVESRT